MSRQTGKVAGALLRATFGIVALLAVQGCDVSTPQGGVAPHTINNDWRVGSTVHLAIGTEIREAQGITSCWHTRVPVDEWEVQVIGGPRNVDGHPWYDTSRKALGDPSGGTGWVDTYQADNSPAVQYGGTQCSYSVQKVIPPPNGSWLAQLLLTIETWWRSLSIVVQAAVVVIAVVLLILTFRGRSLPVIGLVQAVMLGVLLWWLAEQTRPYWESWWVSFASAGAPGFPIVVGLIPIAWWAYARTRYRLPGGLRLALFLALLVVALYLIVPQKLDQWVSQALGLLNGKKA